MHTTNRNRFLAAQAQPRWAAALALTLAALALVLLVACSARSSPPAGPLPLPTTGVTNLIDLELSGDLTVGDDTTFGDDLSLGGNLSLVDGVWNGIIEGNVIFGDDSDATMMWETDGVNGDALLLYATAGHIRATIVSTKSLEIDTGNLAVGNGTPDTTLDGEDAYIEGTLEVDGALNFDGSANFATGVTIAGAAALNGGLTMDSTAFTVADTSGNTSIAGTLTVGGVTTVPTDTEHIGLPTIDAAAITYQSSGALWTAGASEIWFIHALYCHITTNFDCTGDDCTLDIGDGNDADGFLDLIDGEMQTTDTEGTGAPAGWQGFMGTSTRGVYLAEGLGFVYTDDTIDIVVGGTDPAAGAGTCYLVYTRIQ